jgi:hypothetical protein
MSDGAIRPLAIALVVQILLGGALLVWALLGFPLPTAITGADRHPAPAAKVQRGAGGATPIAGAASDVAPRAKVNRFNGPGAFALLREQVQDYGFRPAGSAALRRLAVRLRALLPGGRFEAVPGQPGERNIVASLPGRMPAIVLGAHYDVVDAPKGFVGANDGAGGTAALVTIARAMARAPRLKTDRAVRFVLLDGEEAPSGCEPFYSCGLRGSKYYASHHRREIRSFILLDYIAEKTGMVMNRELGSDEALWAQLRTAAQQVGVGPLFPDATSGEILDDHTPFTRLGIPAIDLIDFDYPQTHTLGDNLDAVSERSLDAVGEAVTRLMTTLRRDG